MHMVFVLKPKHRLVRTLLRMQASFKVQLPECEQESVVLQVNML